MAALYALIRAAWRAINKSFITELNGGTLTLGDAGYVRQQWQNEKITPVLAHIGSTYLNGANVVAQATDTPGPDDDHEIGDNLVTNYVAEARNRLVGVGDDVWHDVRAQIKLGMEAGESVSEIAARIKNVAQVPTARAQTIARTETHAAYEAGAYQQAVFIGGGTKTWLDTNDGKTRETHRLAGKQPAIPIDQPFVVGATTLRFPGDPLGGDPGEIINCVIGSTEVDAPIIQMAMRSWYEGDVIEIETARETLTVTPNHPVLTSLGWVPAKSLKDGDEVFNCRIDRHLGQYDENRRPTQISEVFDLAPVLRDAEREDFPANFHGERRVSKVHVVAEDRLLGLKIVPSDAEEFAELLLTLPNIASLRSGGVGSCEVSLGVTGRRAESLPTSGVSVACECAVFRGGAIGSKKSVGVTSTTDGNVSGGEHATYCPARDVESLSERETAFTVNVTLNHIVRVRRLSFSGHVYNLSTTSGWYTGNSIITGNCRCSVVYDFADVAVEPEPELALVAAGKWKPQDHPRGKDGKFIKSGSLTGFLGQAKPTPISTLTAIKDLTPDKWDNVLTTSQKEHLLEEVDKLAGGPKKIANSLFTKNVGKSLLEGSFDVLQEKDEVPFTKIDISSPPPTKSVADFKYTDLNDYSINGVIAHAPNGDYIEKSGPHSVTYFDADGEEIDSALMGTHTGTGTLQAFIHMNTPESVDGEWTIVPPKAGSSGMTIKSPSSPAPTSDYEATWKTQPKIPDGLKGKPGDPVKVTTGVIWGKHKPGTVILEADHGGDRVVWNGKKYELQTLDENGAWNTQFDMTKKDAYAHLKQESQWVVPGAQSTMTPAVSTPTPTPAPTTPDVPASAPVTSPDVELSIPTVPLQSGNPEMNFLLGEAEKGDLTMNEALTLTVMLTPSHFSLLSKNQRVTIGQRVHNAVKVGKPGAQMALDKWSSLLLAEDDKKFAAEQKTSSTKFMGLKDFKSLLDNLADLTPDEIIAVNKDGFARIRYDEFAGGIVYEEWNGDEGTWIQEQGFDVEKGYDDLALEEWLNDLSGGGWVKPLSSDPNTPGPDEYAGVDDDVSIEEASPTPVATVPYTEESVITNWQGVLFSDKTKTGDVVAQTPDEKYVLKKGSFSWEIETKSPAGHPITVATYSFDNPPMPATLKVIGGDTWIVPPKKTPSLKDATPIGTFSTEVMFAEGLVSYQHGDILGYSGVESMDHLEYRLRVSDMGGDGNNIIVLEVLNKKGSAGWMSMGTYSSYDEFTQDWPNDIFKWNTNPTGDQKKDAPQAVPSPLPTGAPAASEPPAAPVPKYIPHYVVAYMKSLLKNEGKVGYWSKPEKIWDAIKAIQKSYPDPNSPGQSIYTPLDILNALDLSTNTQNNPKPYTSKISKWAGSAKGSEYIAKSPGGGFATSTGQKTAGKPPTPAEVYDKAKTGSYAQGTVLYTGVNSQGNPVKIFASKSVPVGLLSQTEYDDGELGPASYIGTVGALKYLIDVHNMTAVGDGVDAAAAQTKVTKPKVPTQTNVDLGTSTLTSITSDKQQQLYTQFKNKPGTYLDSPEQQIFHALKLTADENGISVLTMIQVIDEVGAQKVGKPNASMFEKKIVKWLQTPQGVALATGQPVPKPARPDFLPGIDPDKTIPSFDASGKYTYNVLPVSSATAWFNKVKAKYGEWTSSQQSGLKTYTGGSYMSINPYLWGEKQSVSSTHMGAIKNAQKGMRPSLEPVLLHRGVGYSGVGGATSHAHLEKMVGQTWRSDGFMSTSVGGHSAFGGSVTLEIEAPPGTPMAWVKPISLHSSENEMLLAAGLSYKIISVKKKGSSGSVVRVRVVPAPNSSGGAA